MEEKEMDTSRQVGIDIEFVVENDRDLEMLEKVVEKFAEMEKDYNFYCSPFQIKLSNY
ncbi:MAG: hypothetical protein SPI59_03125 [Finegoldia sp.]|nr:hypothetical protein [Finegoldia sp.]